MKILKFGGSSLAEPDRIGAVAEIVRSAAEQEPVAVVVSALGGVTDLLLTAARTAAREETATALIEETIEEIERRHLAVLEQLLEPDEQRVARRRVGAAIAELRDLVRGVELVGECTPRTLDRIASYGERLSALLVAGALRRAGCEAADCDARGLVRTDENYGAALVEPEETYRRIREHFESATGLQVVTGFIASSANGETTTLGRSGSDLTAALLGAGLEADVIEIWTDVDGVMSCDPRQVPDAFSLPRLSYEELMELSHFGAKVVFPPTVVPARRRGIPLLIKNTFDPGFPGTRVDEGPGAGAQGGPERLHPITGIASVNNVALLRLEGEGMMGVPGIARRLFDALAEAEVHIILISQASSEHSICFAIDPLATNRARLAVEREFTLELETGLLEPLVVEDEQCVVAIVGEGMRERPGIAARLFRVLGRRGISVRAIAQGSSELNISIVLARGQETRALQAIHESFFRGEDDTLKLVLLGIGGVGGELLSQLRHRATLPRADRVELRLCGIVSSRSMWLARSGVEPGDDPRTALSEHGEAAQLERVAEFLEQLTGPVALVDCTASSAVQALYPRLLRQRISVITANKLAFAGPAAADPRHAPRPDGRGLYFEATVGAGLPVVSSVAAMTRCGDQVRRIEGVFSGTLGYLTTELGNERDFDEVIREAHRFGYTEPDPREDLSGLDVARKLVILAREAGASLELEEVDVRGLLDESYAACDLDEFWQRLPNENERYAELAATARRDSQRLVYLARLDLDADRRASASVGLEMLPGDHPAAAVSGTDNVFAITTAHYDEASLVIRGPGAGTQVTAGGVLADILRAHAESVRDPLIEIPPAPRLLDP